jgi:uncharacterized protein YabE (DUF348 family)
MSDAKPIRMHFQRLLQGHWLHLLIIAVLVTSLVATGFVSAQRKVTIIADDATYEIKAKNSYVHECLAQAGISTEQNDVVNVGVNEKVKNGMIIEVYRGGPVRITADGKSIETTMAKATVGDAIQAAGIVLREQDKTVPGIATRFKPGMDIRVIRVVEKTETRQVPVIYSVERRADDTLEKGVTRVVQEGQDGEKSQTLKVRYEDGQEVSASVLTETIVTPPHQEIILVGTRDMVQTSRGAFGFIRVMTMEATAYLPTDGSPEGLTATGVPARHGIVAVDPRVIPLGTRVYVKGYGLALAADTGGAIKGDKIDLCIENADEAWAFGRRPVKVYILAD